MKILIFVFGESGLDSEENETRPSLLVWFGFVCIRDIHRNASLASRGIVSYGWRNKKILSLQTFHCDFGTAPFC